MTDSCITSYLHLFIYYVIYNFFGLYVPLVDSWLVFDNSRAKPVLISKKNNGHAEVINETLFKMMRKGIG